MKKFGLILMAAGVLALPACKRKFRPTFPAAQIAASLRQLCSHDYKLAVETRRQGNTLQAVVWKVGLFGGRTYDLQGMSREAAETIEHVLLCATRVALSTDAPLEFIEVKMADALTGSTITLWRYVPDIRDSMYQRIGDTEYFSRLVIEVNPGEAREPSEGGDEGESGRGDEGRKSGGAEERAHEGSTMSPPRPLAPSPTPSVHWDKPLTMSEFLAKQIILRARRDGGEGFKAHADLSQPATLGVVIENWPAIEEEGPERVAKVADVVHQSAKAVVKAYRFPGFHGLTLRDGQGVALNSWTL